MATKPSAFAVVLVTAPDIKSARKLARAAVDSGLAACVNIVPGIESHYRWKGAVETAPEFLLIIKTTRRRIGAIEKLIVAKHPYDTPEFLVLRVNAGNARYLKWLADSTDLKPVRRKRVE